MNATSYREIELQIIRWAEQRKIIPNSTPSTQLLKCMSELGELADATIKGDKAGIADGVGDVVVCLINYCALQDIDLTECLGKAYDEIKHRKGTLLPNGVFVKEAA
jgi:NTP pyrophosphatase (non-canonical NTP hydrolase)